MAQSYEREMQNLLAHAHIIVNEWHAMGWTNPRSERVHPYLPEYATMHFWSALGYDSVERVTLPLGINPRMRTALTTAFDIVRHVGVPAYYAHLKACQEEGGLWTKQS